MLKKKKSNVLIQLFTLQCNLFLHFLLKHFLHWLVLDIIVIIIIIFIIFIIIFIYTILYDD